MPTSHKAMHSLVPVIGGAFLRLRWDNGEQQTPDLCRQQQTGGGAGGSDPPGEMPATRINRHPGHQRRPEKLPQRGPLLHPPDGRGHAVRAGCEPDGQAEQGGRDHPAHHGKHQHAGILQQHPEAAQQKPAQRRRPLPQILCTARSRARCRGPANGRPRDCPPC